MNLSYINIFVQYFRSTMKSHVLRAHPQVAKENGADHCYFTLDTETNTKVAQSTRTLFSPSKRAKHRRLTMIRRKGIKKGKRPLLVKTLPGARTSNRLAIKVNKKVVLSKEEIIRDVSNKPLRRRGCARFRPYEEASKLKYRDPNYQELHPRILDKGLEMVGRLVPEVLDVQAAFHGRRLDHIGGGRPYKVIDAKINLITSKTIASHKIVLLDHNYMKPIETTTSHHIPPVSPPIRHLTSYGRSSSEPSANWGSDLMIVDTPDVSQFTDIDSRRKALQLKSQRSVYKRGIGEDYLQVSPGDESPSHPHPAHRDDDVDIDNYYQKKPSRSPRAGDPHNRYPQQPGPHRQHGIPTHASVSVHSNRQAMGTAMVDPLEDHSEERTENYEDMLSGIDDFLKNHLREEDVAALVEGDTGNFMLDSSPMKQANHGHHSQGKQIPPQHHQSHVLQQTPEAISETAEALLSLHSSFDLSTLGMSDNQPHQKATSGNQNVAQGAGDFANIPTQPDLTESLLGNITVSVPVTSSNIQQQPTQMDRLETLCNAIGNTDIGNLDDPVASVRQTSSGQTVQVTQAAVVPHLQLSQTGMISNTQLSEIGFRVDTNQVGIVTEPTIEQDGVSGDSIGTDVHMETNSIQTMRSTQS